MGNKTKLMKCLLTMPKYPHIKRPALRGRHKQQLLTLIPIFTNTALALTRSNERDGAWLPRFQ